MKSISREVIPSAQFARESIGGSVHRSGMCDDNTTKEQDWKAYLDFLSVNEVFVAYRNRVLFGCWILLSNGNFVTCVGNMEL